MSASRDTGLDEIKPGHRVSKGSTVNDSVGWAWGCRIPADSPYLDIAGSFHTTPVLTATAGEAQPSEVVTDDTLALVEQTGHTLFRIIEICEDPT